MIGKLFEIKQQIEEAKMETAKLLGSRQSLVNQLIKKHNCDSVDSGNKKLENLAVSFAKIQNKRDEKLAELLDAYDW